MNREERMNRPVYFEESKSEAAVMAHLDKCLDPRFKQIMASLVKHLHGFVKDVDLTTEEWFESIQFLTALGQICDDKRQEWVLASDVLGVSMLVDAINHRRPGRATENTVRGPFYVGNSPRRRMGDNICLDGKGEPCFVTGRVINEEGDPIEGAKIEIWQTNDDGFYDVQQPGQQPDFNMRGMFETGHDGKYSFQTVKPLSYSIPTDGPVGVILRRMGCHAMRPAHIHFMVEAKDYDQLVTHIFVNGDEYLDSDTVFGVKEDLIVDFKREVDGWHVDFEICLKKKPAPQKA
jgi:protocatechuate 3,4-dioxygenase beta subunit